MKPYIITEAFTAMLSRRIAFLTCIVFLQSTLLPPAQASLTTTATENIRVSLPADFATIQIPTEIGKVDAIFNGQAGAQVIIVQDAHAIPDAQRSIRKAILYFHQKYGVNLVALEGTSAKLDARILKSFPDKERLNKILGQYFDQGELAGGTAAAISGIKAEENSAAGTRMIFQGVEDWPVYEEALGLYLAAMGQEEVVLGELEVGSLKLEDEKKMIYSSELRKIDAAIKAFRGNTSDFMKTLEVLASVKAPEKGSELDLLLQEAKNEGVEQAGAEIELKKISEMIKKLEVGSSKLEETKEFEQKYQAFRTGQLTVKAFALFLRDFLEAAPALYSRLKTDDSRRKGDGGQARLLAKLTRLSGNQKRMTAIEGTKLFSDFEVYAQRIKELLFKTEQDRELDRRDRRLWLAFKLAKLEVSYEDWVELEQMKSAGTWLVDGLKMNSMETLFEPHFAFYRNAQKRDGILFKNLLKVLKSSNFKLQTSNSMPKTALMVAGGFHAHGLCSLLKENGISYALVMPEIKNMPEESHYREQIRGNFSWKDYFEVENGKVNIYNAFIRSARDRLLNHHKSQDSKYQNEELNPKILKNWRDQIIRDLADEGRIEKAGDYTRFIDELSGDGREKSIQKRLAQVDQFLDGLKKLDAQGQFTATNIAKLFPGATVQTLAGSVVLNPRTVTSTAIADGRWGSAKGFSKSDTKKSQEKKRTTAARARLEFRDAAGTTARSEARVNSQGATNEQPAASSEEVAPAKEAAESFFGFLKNQLQIIFENLILGIKRKIYLLSYQKLHRKTVSSIEQGIFDGERLDHVMKINRERVAQLSTLLEEPDILQAVQRKIWGGEKSEALLEKMLEQRWLPGTNRGEPDTRGIVRGNPVLSPARIQKESPGAQTRTYDFDHEMMTGDNVFFYTTEYSNNQNFSAITASSHWVANQDFTDRFSWVSLFDLANLEHYEVFYDSKTKQLTKEGKREYRDQIFQAADARKFMYEIYLDYVLRRQELLGKSVENSLVFFKTTPVGDWEVLPPGPSQLSHEDQSLPGLAWELKLPSELDLVMTDGLFISAADESEYRSMEKSLTQKGFVLIETVQNTRALGGVFIRPGLSKEKYDALLQRFTEAADHQRNFTLDETQFSKIEKRIIRRNFFARTKVKADSTSRDSQAFSGAVSDGKTEVRRTSAKSEVRTASPLDNRVEEMKSLTDEFDVSLRGLKNQIKERKSKISDYEGSRGYLEDDFPQAMLDAAEVEAAEEAVKKGYFWQRRGLRKTARQLRESLTAKQIEMEVLKREIEDLEISIAAQAESFFGEVERLFSEIDQKLTAVFPQSDRSSRESRQVRDVLLYHKTSALVTRLWGQFEELSFLSDNINEKLKSHLKKVSLQEGDLSLWFNLDYRRVWEHLRDNPAAAAFTGDTLVAAVETDVASRSAVVIVAKNRDTENKAAKTLLWLALLNDNVRKTYAELLVVNSWTARNYSSFEFLPATGEKIKPDENLFVRFIQLLGEDQNQLSPEIREIVELILKNLNTFYNKTVMTPAFKKFDEFIKEFSRRMKARLNKIANESEVERNLAYWVSDYLQEEKDRGSDSSQIDEVRSGSTQVIVELLRENPEIDLSKGFHWSEYQRNPVHDRIDQKVADILIASPGMAKDAFILRVLSELEMDTLNPLVYEKISEILKRSRDVNEVNAALEFLWKNLKNGKLDPDLAQTAVAAAAENLNGLKEYLSEKAQGFLRLTEEQPLSRVHEAITILHRLGFAGDITDRYLLSNVMPWIERIHQNGDALLAVNDRLSAFGYIFDISHLTQFFEWVSSEPGRQAFATIIEDCKQLQEMDQNFRYSPASGVAFGEALVTDPYDQLLRHFDWIKKWKAENRAKISSRLGSRLGRAYPALEPLVKKWGGDSTFQLMAELNSQFTFTNSQQVYTVVSTLAPFLRHFTFEETLGKVAAIASSEGVEKLHLLVTAVKSEAAKGALETRQAAEAVEVKVGKLFEFARQSHGLLQKSTLVRGPAGVLSLLEGTDDLEGAESLLRRLIEKEGIVHAEVLYAVGRFIAAGAITPEEIKLTGLEIKDLADTGVLRRLNSGDFESEIGKIISDSKTFERSPSGLSVVEHYALKNSSLEPLMDDTGVPIDPKSMLGNYFTKKGTGNVARQLTLRKIFNILPAPIGDSKNRTLLGGFYSNVIVYGRPENYKQDLDSIHMIAMLQVNNEINVSQGDIEKILAAPRGSNPQSVTMASTTFLKGRIDSIFGFNSHNSSGEDQYNYETLSEDAKKAFLDSDFVGDVLKLGINYNNANNGSREAYAILRSLFAAFLKEGNEGVRNYKMDQSRPLARDGRQLPKELFPVLTDVLKQGILGQPAEKEDVRAGQLDALELELKNLKDHQKNQKDEGALEASLEELIKVETAKLDAVLEKAGDGNAPLGAAIAEAKAQGMIQPVIDLSANETSRKNKNKVSAVIKPLKQRLLLERVGQAYVETDKIAKRLQNLWDDKSMTQDARMASVLMVQSENAGRLDEFKNAMEELRQIAQKNGKDNFYVLSLMDLIGMLNILSDFKENSTDEDITAVLSVDFQEQLKIGRYSASGQGNCQNATAGVATNQSLMGFIGDPGHLLILTKSGERTLGFVLLHAATIQGKPVFIREKVYTNFTTSVALQEAAVADVLRQLANKTGAQILTPKGDGSFSTKELILAPSYVNRWIDFRGTSIPASNTSQPDTAGSFTGEIMDTSVKTSVSQAAIARSEVRGQEVKSQGEVLDALADTEIGAALQAAIADPVKNPRGGLLLSLSNGFQAIADLIAHDLVVPYREISLEQIKNNSERIARARLQKLFDYDENPLEKEALLELFQGAPAQQTRALAAVQGGFKAAKEALGERYAREAFETYALKILVKFFTPAPDVTRDSRYSYFDARIKSLEQGGVTAKDFIPGEPFSSGFDQMTHFRQKTPSGYTSKLTPDWLLQDKEILLRGADDDVSVLDTGNGLDTIKLAVTDRLRELNGILESRARQPTEADFDLTLLRPLWESYSQVESIQGAIESVTQAFFLEQHRSMAGLSLKRLTNQQRVTAILSIIHRNAGLFQDLPDKFRWVEYGVSDGTVAAKVYESLTKETPEGSRKAEQFFLDKKGIYEATDLVTKLIFVRDTQNGLEAVFSDARGSDHIDSLIQIKITQGPLDGTILSRGPDGKLSFPEGTNLDKSHVEKLKSVQEKYLRAADGKVEGYDISEAPLISGEAKRIQTRAEERGPPSALVFRQRNFQDVASEAEKGDVVFASNVLIPQYVVTEKPESAEESGLIVQESMIKALRAMGQNTRKYLVIVNEIWSSETGKMGDNKKTYASLIYERVGDELTLNVNASENPEAAWFSSQVPKTLSLSEAARSEVSPADAKSEVRAFVNDSAELLTQHVKTGTPTLAQAWAKIAINLELLQAKETKVPLNTVLDMIHREVDAAAGQSSVDPKVTAAIDQLIRATFFEDKGLGGMALGIKFLEGAQLSVLADIAREMASQQLKTLLIETPNRPMWHQFMKEMARQGVPIEDLNIVPVRNKIENKKGVELYFGDGQNYLSTILTGLGDAASSEIILVGADHELANGLTLSDIDQKQVQGTRTKFQFAAAVALAFGQKEKSAGVRSQKLSKTFKAALIKNMNLNAAQINQLPDIYQVDAHGNLFVSDNAVFRLFSLVSEMRASQAAKSAA